MRQNSDLRPHVIKVDPSEKERFSMTQFAPVTEDFFYADDYLVILSPFDVIWEAPVFARSLKSLDDHIRLIQENQIEKAIVIAEDISFLRRCPNIKSLQVIVPYSVTDFDYSPLYDLPALEALNCQTVYGAKKEYTAVIDYSRFSKLRDLSVNGARGHKNITATKGLHRLYLGQGQPESKTLAGFDFSELEELVLCQASVKSLAGIERAKRLRKVSIYNCRSIENLSDLNGAGESLEFLEIQSCGKATNFEWLYQLPNLRELVLFGSNRLKNLHFLESMNKLQSFRFTVNVLDGDLSLCRNIPYVYCKNRKHYNLKDCDLPKGIE